MTDIIVPVFNVEKYLSRCIDSILAQICMDYKLILVDDGSTDNSGKICDEYASSNDIIIVIHKSNGGLSSARNAGLNWAFEHSESKWITFIDSDDWINSHYLESLLNAALKTRTSVSICEFASVNSEEDAPQPLAIDTEIRSAESLYCERNTTSITAWGKLYAKELWNNIRYPEGKIHEDEFVTYKILFEVGEIAYISSPLYYYYNNPEGITRSEWTPTRLAALDGKQEQIRYMKANGYRNALREAVLDYAKIACAQISSIDRKKYPVELRGLRRRLKKHIVLYQFCGVFSMRRTYGIYNAAFPYIMGILNRLRTIERKVYYFYNKTRYKPRVMNSQETIKYILKTNCSVSRFGDGEIDLLFKRRAQGFQRIDDVLSEALMDVLKNAPDNCLICVPDIFGSLRIYRDGPACFWKSWLYNDNHRKKLVQLLFSCKGKKYVFGNTQFTRPYMDYPGDKNMTEMLPLIKMLWEKKDILIVEGQQTRLGVNNDLLDNAASVQRILAPAVNAIDKYSEILSATEKAAGNRLILLALGPTATILVCELCRHGFQAIDIGHIDIEYEWYLRGTKSKLPIPGKYTNEVKGGNNVEECENPAYLKQIITIID